MTTVREQKMAEIEAKKKELFETKQRRDLGLLVLLIPGSSTLLTTLVLALHTLGVIDTPPATLYVCVLFTLCMLTMGSFFATKAHHTIQEVQQIERELATLEREVALLVAQPTFIPTEVPTNRVAVQPHPPTLLSTSPHAPPNPTTLGMTNT
ncbi:MAG: hypothetical protein HY939_06195 [Gammaproteobacteria bacterium]|nr:hypothetical protein [Gammaproteobacteria bacterium]